MSSVQLPPFLDANDWDDDLERCEPAAHCVRKAWAVIDEWLDDNATSRLIKLEMICRWHEYLFGPTFPQFAGRIRSVDFPKEVHFGAHNGVGSRFVLDELSQYEERAQDLIRQLDSYVT